MTSKSKSGFRLEVTRLIKAPRERVYAAWTDPSELKKWFGPENVQTRDLTAEPRVGGTFRWELINPEGKEMTIHGEYRELIPGKKIVFTWQWKDDEDWKNYVSVVRIELFERAGATEVRLTHEELPSTQSRDDHRQGWNSVLDKLEKFIGALGQK